MSAITEKITVRPLAATTYPLSARDSPSVPVFANTLPFSGPSVNRARSDPSTPPTGRASFHVGNHVCVAANASRSAVARGVTRSFVLNPDPS